LKIDKLNTPPIAQATALRYPQPVPETGIEAKIVSHVLVVIVMKSREAQIPEYRQAAYGGGQWFYARCPVSPKARFTVRYRL
jgi:hypothetical protein